MDSNFTFSPSPKKLGEFPTISTTDFSTENSLAVQATSSTVMDTPGGSTFGGIQASLQRLMRRGIEQETPRYWPELSAKQMAAPATNQNITNGNPTSSTFEFSGSPEHRFLLGAMLSNSICKDDLDRKESLYQYTEAAEQGHTAAQTRLGYKYATGSGVTPDPAAALRWLHEAVTKSDPKAALMLGVMYEEGLGMPRHRVSAHHWYDVSAKLGNPEALFRLGTMLSNGVNGTIDIDPYGSVPLYEKAAKQGHPAALNRIGLKYATGSGVEPNYETALKWLYQAAKQGYLPALESIGRVYLHLKNYQQAIDWFHLAALHGYYRALLNVSAMYKTGLGVPKDLARARTWNDMAQDLEAHETNFSLGRALETGRFAPRDPRLARHWYTKAANLGHIPAMARLQFVFPLRELIKSSVV